MAKLIFLTMLAFLSGCASLHYEIAYPSIEAPVIAFSATAKTVPFSDHLEEFRVATSYRKEQAPILWPNGGCIVYFPEPTFGDPRNQMVIRLSRVIEQWVPIEGKVKRYYEFNVY